MTKYSFGPVFKLRVTRDKCSILSNCSILKNDSQTGKFITADKPIKMRRENNFEYLKSRAEQAGNRVSVIENILVIDDVKVFPVEKCFTGWLTLQNHLWCLIDVEVSSLSRVTTLKLYSQRQLF